MSSQAPSRSALRTSRARNVAAVFAVALSAAAMLSACGGDDGEATAAQRDQATVADGAQPKDFTEGGVIDISGTDAVGENLAGSVASLVECRDWNMATTEQKLATIDDVRSQVSRRDTGISSPALTDDEALQIFDNSCEPAWAEGLRLYKIYTHAAGFAPLAREIGQ